MENSLKGNWGLNLASKRLGNKLDYPVIDFLNYLIENRKRYDLQLTVKRGFNRKIRRLTFQFNEEEEQVFSFGLWTRAGYSARLENVQSFLEWIATQNNFNECHDLYIELKEEWRWMVALYENQLNKDTAIAMPEEDESLRRRIVSTQKDIDITIHLGALFIQQLVAIFEDYEETTLEKQSVVLSPAEDHIEVELLTILEDAEVSEETKEEARLTLEKYRLKQQKKTEVGNQKDENARITLRTIQEHYLNE